MKEGSINWKNCLPKVSALFYHHLTATSHIVTLLVLSFTVIDSVAVCELLTHF